MEGGLLSETKLFFEVCISKYPLTSTTTFANNTHSRSAPTIFIFYIYQNNIELYILPKKLSLMLSRRRHWSLLSFQIEILWMFTPAISHGKERIHTIHLNGFVLDLRNIHASFPSFEFQLARGR
jgi:hypothetical protein